MAKLTIVFGILLIVLGVVGYIGTGSTHPTALIPAIEGVLLLLAGWLAQSPIEKKRMLWMHVAVTVGLLGFLGSVKGLVDYIRIEMHTAPMQVNAQAAEAKAAMALISFLFVILCVRSFVRARLLKA